MYMRRLRKGDVPQTRVERALPVGETGNCPTGNNVELTADPVFESNVRSSKAETSDL